MGGQIFKINAAVFLILRQGDKVLLSLRQGTGWKDGWWSLVVGHVDGGEFADDALVREAKEEIGVNISTNDLRHVYTLHRKGDDPDYEYIDLFFECTKWTGDIVNVEPDMCGGLEWFDINSLPDKLVENIKLVLGDYDKGRTYGSFERN